MTGNYLCARRVILEIVCRAIAGAMTTDKPRKGLRVNRPAAPAQPVDYAERVSGLLRAFDRVELADDLDHKLASHGSVATVVVVGEVKRGKSSLVNALYGRPGLVPVDVDANTSVPIQITSSADEEESATLSFGDHATKVPLEQVGDWATTTGAQVDAARQAETLPSTVTLSIRHATELRAMVVDTPGVGGLDPEAVDLALAAARGAGVLIMVVDATTPITLPEIEILQRAADEVGSVIVAVSKIDKNLTRWRHIVVKNRELIAARLGREVPVVGVSSLRALAALEEPGAGRQQVEKTSGISALRALVRQRAAAADTALAHLALRRGVEELRAIAADEELKQRTAEQPSEVIEEVKARKAHLRDLQARGQEWETYLNRDLNIAKQQVLARLDENLDRVRDEWTRYINKSGMKVLRSKPQVFTAQIEVAVNAVIQRALGQTSSGLQRQCAQLFGTDLVWQQISVHAVRQMVGHQIFDREIGKKTENILDPSVVTLGVIGGSTLGGGLASGLGATALAGVGASLLPIPVVVGGGWIAINLAYRALRTGKQNLVTWLRESCNAARVATNREIDSLLNISRTEMVLRYRAWLREQVAEANEQQEQAQKAARQDEMQRRSKAERHAKNAKVIRNTIAGAERILAAGPTAAPRGDGSGPAAAAPTPWSTVPAGGDRW